MSPIPNTDSNFQMLFQKNTSSWGYVCPRHGGRPHRGSLSSSRPAWSASALSDSSSIHKGLKVQKSPLPTCRIFGCLIQKSIRHKRAWGSTFLEANSQHILLFTCEDSRKYWKELAAFLRSRIPGNYLRSTCRQWVWNSHFQKQSYLTYFLTFFINNEELMSDRSLHCKTQSPRF